MLAGGRVFRAAGVGLHSVDRLDVDHLRAPLAQQLRDVRPGPDNGDRGHAQALQRERERLARLLAAGPPRRGVQRREVQDGAGVLAEVRRAPGRLGRRFGEAEGVPGIGERRAVPVGDFVPPAARAQLRILEQVRGRHHRAGQQTGGLRLRDGVELGAVGEEVGDRLIHLVAEAADGAVGLVDRLEQVGAPDPLEQARQAPAGADDADEAVGAGEHAEADPARARPGASGGDAAVGRGGQMHGAAVAAAGLAAVDADVDPVARAAPLLRVFRAPRAPRALCAAQREQDGERGGRAGVVVRVVPGDLERLAVGRARRVQRPADRLQGEFGAAVVAVGPGLPERGDRAEHEAGVDCVQRVPAPAGGGGLAGRAVLDHRVDLPRQAAHGGRAVVGVRIEDDRLFIGVEVQEEAGGLGVGRAAGKRPKAPRGVAAARLDLDHARAEVGQQLGRVGPRHVTRQVEDCESVKRPGHGGFPAGFGALSAC